MYSILHGQCTLRYNACTLHFGLGQYWNSSLVFCSEQKSVPKVGTASVNFYVHFRNTKKLGPAPLSGPDDNEIYANCDALNSFSTFQTVDGIRRLSTPLHCH